MSSSSSQDSHYAYDEAATINIRKEKKWMQDPKYFKRVVVSPAAAMKMQTHGQSGVEKGIKKGGKPTEVMGLLLGRPDDTDPHCFLIVDAQALPIEGFETSVVADDAEVQDYQLQLLESNEKTRVENFCGCIIHIHSKLWSTAIASFLTRTSKLNYYGKDTMILLVIHGSLL